jgi:hypothetical protein
MPNSHFIAEKQLWYFFRGNSSIQLQIDKQRRPLDRRLEKVRVQISSVSLSLIFAHFWYFWWNLAHLSVCIGILQLTKVTKVWRRILKYDLPNDWFIIRRTCLFFNHEDTMPISSPRFKWPDHMILLGGTSYPRLLR